MLNLADRRRDGVKEPAVPNTPNYGLINECVQRNGYIYPKPLGSIMKR
jgi:hypothetical protein